MNACETAVGTRVISTVYQDVIAPDRRWQIIHETEFASFLPHGMKIFGLDQVASNALGFNEAEYTVALEQFATIEEALDYINEKQSDGWRVVT